MPDTRLPATAPRAVFALLVAATILGFAGTDLILPAVPTMPDELGGAATHAQFVLAAYVAGFSCGLLAFGALGDRFSAVRILAGSTCGFALASLACALADEIGFLIAARFVQGAAASAGVVVMPGIVRRMYDEAGAVRALGAIASIEALAPALAPVVGAWLLASFGWRSGFAVSAALGLAVAGAFALFGAAIPEPPARRPGGYAALLRDGAFLRPAASHALVIAGLLVIVFGAPNVFVHAMGGSISDFIAMQVTGVACFIVCANLSARIVARIGAPATIFLGTALCAASACAILGATVHGTTPAVVTALFAPFNAGLGLRGPPGFVAALKAAGGDDARASALVVVAITGLTALGTAAAAPYILAGMWPIAAIAVAMELAAVGIMVVPRARPAGRGV